MSSRGVPYDVNCSILFTELPLPERPAAAREAVPPDADVDALGRSVQDAGAARGGG